MGHWLLKVLQGALIGAGAILPGVSGGVMCVIFGIYEPLLSFFKNPAAAFKRHYRLFIPLGLGAPVGFIGLARGITWLFGAHSTLAVSLFGGLIAGMLPGLFRECGTKGRPPKAWLTLAVTFSLLWIFLMLLEKGEGLTVNPGAGWYFAAGAIWGLSLVAPGLSSSAILMFLGLYEPMAQGVGALDGAVLLPLGAGVICALFLTAKGMDYLLKTYYAQTSHGILGVVLASWVMLIPSEFASRGEGILCLLFALMGAVIAWGLDQWGQKLRD